MNININKNHYYLIIYIYIYYISLNRYFTIITRSKFSLRLSRDGLLVKRYIVLLHLFHLYNKL